MDNGKIKNLKNQVDSIFNNDFLILDRNKIPFRISGESFKKFSNSIINSSAKYCRDDGEACETKGEVFTLGKNILSELHKNVITTEIVSGLPIKIFSKGVSSEIGWMFFESGTPNKIKISFSESILEFAESDTTSLVDKILLESIYGVYIQISDIPFKFTVEEEDDY